jgi:putative ABC transport system permease protein
VRNLDSRIAVSNFKALSEAVDVALAPQRFATALMSIFAGFAVVLAAVGLYGVVSCIAGQRTYEIGVRLALGATPRDVARLVATQAARLAAVAIVAGLCGAAAAGQLMSSLLFGVESRDPITYLAAAAALGTVCGLAMYVPARRAMRVSPLTALRVE